MVKGTIEIVKNMIIRLINPYHHAFITNIIMDHALRHFVLLLLLLDSPQEIYHNYAVSKGEETFIQLKK